MSNPIIVLHNRVKENVYLHVAFCVTGIVGCLMLYGVLQERIMQHPFGEGEQAEKFKYSLFMVMCNRLLTCSLAAGLLWHSGLDLKPVAPVWAYAAVSFSNVVATSCQYEALKYVSFPVQTLVKCAKMIPVMIWSTVMMKKKYTIKDYAVAVAITLGCTMFFLTGDTTAKNTGKDVGYAVVWGLALMVGYLGFDGFTSTFQDKLFKGYEMSTYNQIMYVTAFSALTSSFFMVSAGQLFPALAFVSRHPDALQQIVVLSLAATLSQLFISTTIKTYGALLFATVMTTRQFLSILLSCVVFVHPLSLWQWLATIIVFGALYYKAFARPKKAAKVTPPTSGADAEANPLLKVTEEAAGGREVGAPEKV